MTQKERQDRSKEEICRAAMEEFGTLGYDKVTMERICGNHGISKGMMYHYYSNKDELFLLCVERTFTDLKAHVERDMGELEGQTFLDTIKNFFMIREYYFQLHPKARMIFEEVLLHPPKHLVAQIQELRGPIRDAVLLNSAAAIVASRGLEGGDLKSAMARALEIVTETLDSGRCAEIMAAATGR